jgi:hypothetical protein
MTHRTVERHLLRARARVRSAERDPPAAAKHADPDHTPSLSGAARMGTLFASSCGRRRRAPDFGRLTSFGRSALGHVRKRYD